MIIRNLLVGMLVVVALVAAHFTVSGNRVVVKAVDSEQSDTLSCECNRGCACGCQQTGSCGCQR
jgi:hypothetical protein